DYALNKGSAFRSIKEPSSVTQIKDSTVLVDNGPVQDGVKSERDAVRRTDALKRIAAEKAASIAKGVQTDAPLKKAPTPLPTPQPEIATRENAFSTFSLNVSDVSFKLAAASLQNNVIPDPGSIRVEEFINAFNYH